MSEVHILSLTKSTGGIAFYNKMLLSELDAGRFRSHTIGLSENADSYVEDLKSAGLSAEPFDMARYSIDLRGDLRVLRRVLAEVRENRSDILLCHGSKAGFIGRAVGRMTGLPVVYCQASLPFLRRIQGNKAPLYWALEYLAGRFGGHVVALTENARRETLARRLVDAWQISVIRTGIDTERFRPRGIRTEVATQLGLDPARPIVGWIGRMESQKAPLDFVEAVARVASRHPEAQFVMAGEGRLEGQVQSHLAAAGLAERLRVLPWQSDVAWTLQGFDIYVLSSLWEGLPITLLEAMGCGCAPISTDVDGCGDAIEQGVSGILVRPGAPDEMASALSGLLGSPERRARMSEAAREQTLERFDKRQWVAKWTELLSRLSAERRPAQRQEAARREPT